jgi:hypothetical protein
MAALQAQVDSLDTVPVEARSFYIPNDPNDHNKGYQLLVETASDTPEAKAWKAKLGEFRDSNTGLHKTNAQLKQELEKVKQELAEKKTAPKSNGAAPAQELDLDALMAERLKPVQENYEGQTKALRIELEKTQQMVAERDRRLEAQTKEQLLTDAVNLSGLTPVSDYALRDFKKNVLDYIRLNDTTGEPYILDRPDEKGRPRFSARNAAEYMSLVEYLHEVAQSTCAHYFGASQGGGARGSNRGLDQQGSVSNIPGGMRVIPGSDKKGLIKNMDLINQGKIRVT